ncbi:MAG: hypothetical protein ACRDS9_22100, partial [Pseudonocardiaceae bacterium]
MWDDEIPIEPFAFGAGPSKPSEFIIELTIDGIRFEYVLEANSEKVMYEGLFHYPEKKRRRIFEREGGDLKLQRGLGGLSGTRELLTERTLALSIARRFDEPLVSSFARDLLRTQTQGFPPRRTRGFGVIGERIGYGPAVSRQTWRWFEERDQLSLFGDRELASPSLGGKDREQALALLRLADLGIDDVVIDTQEVSFPDTSDVRTQRRVRLVHRTTEERAPLDFAAESEGTRTWFQLIGPVLTA